jgi:hypothetical protein
MAFEKQFVVYADHGTAYRLRATPDAPIEDGFKAGAVLEWSDDECKTWTGYFHIAADCIADIAAMLSEAASNK